MIIDMHVHLFEEKMWPKKFLDVIVEIKRQTLTKEQFKHYYIDGRIERLIKDMDDAKVDISVCLPVDLAFMCQEEPEIPFWKANEYVAEAQQKYPDRIIGFVGMDPMRPGAVDFLEKGIKEFGLRGVKIFPGWYYPTDERIAPFMQKIEELGIPLLIHQGADPLPFVMKYGDPRYVDDLLMKYPRLKVVVAHCARGFEDLLVEMIMWRPNRIWADISALQYEYGASPWRFLMRMRYLLDRVPDFILTGSDWPYAKFAPNPSHREWIDLMKNLKLPKAFLDMGMRQFTQGEREKVLVENARKLLNL